MCLPNAVEQILRNIPPGMAFDSHFVIGQLVQRFSDRYLRFCSRYANSDETTRTAHQQIGRVINSFNGLLIQRLRFRAFSLNIHGIASPCAAWRRR